MFDYYGGFDSQVRDSWIVILDKQGKTVLTYRLPLIKLTDYGNSMINIVETITELRNYPNLLMIAEKVGSSSNSSHYKYKGAKATQTFGSCLNLIAQIQVMPDVTIKNVEVSVWKKALGLTADKELSKAVALDMGLVIPKGLKTYSDNLAESYLLAQFGLKSQTEIIEKPAEINYLLDEFTGLKKQRKTKVCK